MTATRTALLALAERVEAATGADRELDALAALAAGYTTNTDGYGEGNDWWTPDGKALPRVHGFGARPPAFTASLDAAMSLVPSGWRVSRIEEDWRSGRWHCQLSRRPSAALLVSYDAGRTVGWETTDTKPNGASTPALALTAAALRALATETPA